MFDMQLASSKPIIEVVYCAIDYHTYLLDNDDILLTESASCARNF